MEPRGLIRLCGLFFLAGLLALAAAGPRLAQSEPSAPEYPYLLNATLNVNGTLITGANTTYTVGVTDTSGNPLPDAATGDATLTYGSVVAGRFEYQIPMSGSTTPSAVCISVYSSGTQLYLTNTSPGQGSCNPGSIELTGLTAGDSTGFGGIPGEPNNSSHTFSSPLTAVTEASAAISVTCGSNARNSTTPESFGNVNLGQTATDTTCKITNTIADSNLIITNVTASITSAATPTGCGFSVVSPTTFPISLAYSTSQALTLAFTPCGTGSAQTGALTITYDGAPGSSASTYCVGLAGTGVTAINLVSGWNLIGLAVPFSNAAVSNVLSKDLTVPASNVSVIWAYVNGQWQYWDPNDTTGSLLQQLTTGNGYWFFMTRAGTLTIK
jgi:hypothetical protein